MYPHAPRGRHQQAVTGSALGESYDAGALGAQSETCIPT